MQGPDARTGRRIPRRLVRRLSPSTLEHVSFAIVEAGDMTKDLALLVGAEQKWLSTTGFLDKIDQNLKKAMAV